MSYERLRILHPWRRRLLFLPLLAAPLLIVTSIVTAAEWCFWRVVNFGQWGLRSCRWFDGVTWPFVEWSSGFETDAEYKARRRKADDDYFVAHYGDLGEDE